MEESFGLDLVLTGIGGVLRHVLRDVLSEHFRLVEPDTYSI
jgi:hypothetical protein